MKALCVGGKLNICYSVIWIFFLKRKSNYEFCSFYIEEDSGKRTSSFHSRFLPFAFTEGRVKGGNGAFVLLIYTRLLYRSVLYKQYTSSKAVSREQMATWDTYDCQCKHKKE